MRIIRVGVLNNFNFTEREINHLKTFEDKGKIFVNSNSFVNIKADYPSIITINPYLKFCEPQGDLSNIKACRVKITASSGLETYNEERKALEWCLRSGIPILVTFQRFKTIKTMDKFVVNTLKRKSYIYDHGWMRPTKEARLAIKKNIHDFVRSFAPKRATSMVHFCDFNGTGCEDCKNCIKLTYPEFPDATIYGLNLSTSGDDGKCMFNCPDAFCKVCLSLCKNHKPKCDKLFRNRKQKGLTHHA